jgi:cytochrome b561
MRSSPGYDDMAIALHWIIAAMILANLGLSLVFEGLQGAERGALIRIHKSLGVSILALVVLRLAWRLVGPRVTPLAGLAPTARRLADVVHKAFYLVLLLMPLSGWAMISADRGGRATLVWGVLPWPRITGLVDLPPAVRDQVHAALALLHLGLGVALAALIGVHVGGVLLHQVFEGRPQLQRMTPRLLLRLGR